jgi:hypothetical protein
MSKDTSCRLVWQALFVKIRRATARPRKCCWQLGKGCRDHQRLLLAATSSRRLARPRDHAAKSAVSFLPAPISLCPTNRDPYSSASEVCGWPPAVICHGLAISTTGGDMRAMSTSAYHHNYGRTPSSSPGSAGRWCRPRLLAFSPAIVSVFLQLLMEACATSAK